MTDPAGLDLDALERLCEAATPGPWHDCVIHKSGCGGFDLPPDKTLPKAPTGALIQSAEHTPSEAVIQASNYDNSPWCLPEDRAFIATARTALPAALATICALQDEVRQWKSAFDIMEKKCVDRGGKLIEAQARVAELEALVRDMMPTERRLYPVQRRLRDRALATLAGQPADADAEGK